MPLSAGRHADPFSRVGKPLPTSLRARHSRDPGRAAARAPGAWNARPVRPRLAADARRADRRPSGPVGGIPAGACRHRPAFHGCVARHLAGAIPYRISRTPESASSRLTIAANTMSSVYLSGHGSRSTATSFGTAIQALPPSFQDHEDLRGSIHAGRRQLSDAVLWRLSRNVIDLVGPAGAKLHGMPISCGRPGS